MGIGKRIERLLSEKSLSIKELSERSNVSYNTIYAMIKRDSSKVNPNTLEKIAAVLGMRPYELYDFTTTHSISTSETPNSDISPREKGIKVNILGRVAAGIPIDAIEEIIDTEEITEELAQTGTFFGLKIKGDSMTPNICDGDIVIVRQQDDAESEDIVIATINGDEATCKKLKKYLHGIALISINSAYEPMYFTNKEINEIPVQIIGRVIELRRTF